MTKQNGHKAHITFVLDESGSMMQTKDQTISGFNEFMDSQQDKSLGEARVTLVKFNSQAIKIVYQDKLIENVKALNHASYTPNGTTPLYDAIAQAIKTTKDNMSDSQKVLEKLAGHPVPQLIIVVIMTDGLENSSRMFNRANIFELIENKKGLGWTFVFLGADQDSWEAASGIGIAQGSTANYASAHTERAFAGVAQSMSSYRTDSNLMVDQFAAAMSEGDKVKATAELKKIKKLRTNYFKGKKEL